MPDNKDTQELTAIRELLTKTFDDPSLDAFTHDNYPAVYDTFGRGMRKDEKITLLLDHCRRIDGGQDRLVAEVEARSSSTSTPPPDWWRRWAWLVAGAALFAVLVIALVRWPPNVGQDKKTTEPSTTPPPPAVTVAIKTAHNKYVTAMGPDRNLVIRAETTQIDRFERFVLFCRDEGKIALRTYHETDGGYPTFVTPLGPEADWRIKAEPAGPGRHEELVLLDADTAQRLSCPDVIEALQNNREVKVAFKTWDKESKTRLVTAMDVSWDWVLRAETAELRTSERFTMTLAP